MPTMALLLPPSMVCSFTFVAATALYEPAVRAGVADVVLCTPQPMAMNGLEPVTV